MKKTKQTVIYTHSWTSASLMLLLEAMRKTVIFLY